MDTPDSAPAPGRLVEQAREHERQGQYQQVRRLALQAVRAVERDGGTSRENAEALFYAATTDMLLHYHSRADELFNRAQLMFEACGEADRALLAASRRVKCSIWMRDLSGAEHRLWQLEGGLDQSAPQRIRGECASARGHIAFRRGQWEEAYRRFAEARELYESAGEQNSLLLALNGMAGACCELGRQDEARRLYSSALEGFTELGNQRRIWDIRVNLATLDCYMGHYQQARVGLEQCLQQAEDWLEPEYRGRVLFNLGITELYLGDFRSARKNLLRATQAGESQSVRTDMGESLMYIALAELGLGNPQSAAEYLESSEQYVEQSEVLSRHAAAVCRALIAGATGKISQSQEAWNSIVFAEARLQDDFWRVVPHLIGHMLAGGPCCSAPLSPEAAAWLDSCRLELEAVLARVRPAGGDSAGGEEPG